jgi:hypothetical protein
MGEGILGSYYLKDGVALELRFAARARATKDLDVGLEGPRAGRLDLLRRSLALGFDEFAFRVSDQPSEGFLGGEAPRLDESVAPLRKVKLRGRNMLWWLPSQQRGFNTWRIPKLQAAAR